MAATGNLLEARGLSVTLRSSIGPPTLIGPVDLSIPPKGVTALVGESGCGKTVVSLAVLGLLPPGVSVEGSILFAGKDLLTMSNAEIAATRGKEITYIPQSPATSLNPVIRTGEQVKETLRFHRGLSGEALKGEMLSLFRSVGLHRPERVAESWPHALSGGMCRRVTVSAALACDPRLLIADEPTSGLDVPARDRVLQILGDAAEGRAMLLITHDLEAAARISDRIAVMYSGEMVEVGATDQVLSSPMHPYTRGLLNSLPSHGLVPLPGDSPLLNALPRGCRFAPRCPLARETCKTVHPPLIQTDTTRLVRCDPLC